MDLESLIKSLGEQDFHCLPNEGNAGDGLIHAGLDRLAARLGLRLEKLGYPAERTGKNLLFVGAGSFCRGSWHMVNPLRYYCTRFENVYVLPASFETTFAPIHKLLRELPTNVTLFCRERISYDAVLKIVPRPEKIFLDHDLAFQLDVSRWKKPGQGHLNAFRTDNESRLGRVPASNFDISNMGREYHHDLILDTLSNFESVNTDRLHVAIAGALLEKTVQIFEGNYHKIRGIYDYSLREKFPNVRLCGANELKRVLAESDRLAFRKRVHQLVLRLPRADDLMRVIKERRSRVSTK
jgi:hypothetical protein